jgi:hypothetical protein
VCKALCEQCAKYSHQVSGVQVCCIQQCAVFIPGEQCARPYVVGSMRYVCNRLGGDMPYAAVRCVHLSCLIPAIPPMDNNRLARRLEANASCRCTGTAH